MLYLGANTIFSDQYEKYARQRKKVFHRVISGLTVAQFRNEKVRFMTLTSTPTATKGMTNDEMFDFLQYNKRRLYKKIEKKYGFRPVDITIKTNEGYGVMHILFRGGFISQQWLSDTWNLLTGAYIVDIRIPRGDPKDGAKYLAGQYLSNQKCTAMRYSMSNNCRGSKNWIVPQCMKKWTRLKNLVKLHCRRLDDWSDFRNILFSNWDEFLRREVSLDVWLSSA